MRMDEIGYNHKHDASFLIDRPNGAGDWLFLIIKTPGVFRIDGTDIHVSANSFILYTPEYPQYYHADQCEYRDDWIHFGPDEEEQELMRRLGIPFNTIVSLNDTSHLSLIVKYMCYEQYSSNLYRKESVDHHFYLLLYKLGECIASARLSSSIKETSYMEKVLWLRESIYRWPAREWNINDMAEELKLSRSRLQHLYSETFGTGITKDIQTSRLNKAVELLKTSEMSIAAIGTAVGYANISYFNRQFRAAFGKTPTEYQHDYLEKNDETDNQ